MLTYFRSVLTFCTCLISIYGFSQPTVGVQSASPQVLDGYTLLYPLTSKSTYLIDNCGNTINEWNSEFSPGASAYLLENGNLLRTAKVASQGNFFNGGLGGRIELFDWSGELVWHFEHLGVDFQLHHDIAYLPNGNILAIVWERKSAQEAIESGYDPTTSNIASLLSEKVIEIEPNSDGEGSIVWEWSIWDHLIQEYDSSRHNFGVVQDHPELLDLNFKSNLSSDWIHLNGIDYNEQLDQIMLTSRALSEVWIIDHSTTSEESAGHQGGDYGKGGDFLYRWGQPSSYSQNSDTQRKLFLPHHAHWITEGVDKGNILIFNNGVDRPEGRYSSVDVINPHFDSILNAYPVAENGLFLPTDPYDSYSSGTDFYSSKLSGAQRLPNENTLICDGNAGHLSEISKENDVVWSYIIPVNSSGPISQGNPANGNSAFRALKYPVDYPAFESKDLTPRTLIEADSISTNCTTTTTTQKNLQIHPPKVNLYPNPTTDQLNVSFRDNTSVEYSIEILGRDGKLFYSRRIKSHLGMNKLSINVETLPPGLYSLKLQSSKKSTSATFIK